MSVHLCENERSSEQKLTVVFRKTYGHFFKTNLFLYRVTKSSTVSQVVFNRKRIRFQP